MMASIASTADGINIEGNNFKVNALIGSPDMLLFACERIIELEKTISSIEQNTKPIDASIQPGDKVIYERCFGDQELFFVGMAPKLSSSLNDCVVTNGENCCPVIYAELKKIE